MSVAVVREQSVTVEWTSSLVQERRVLERRDSHKPRIANACGDLRSIPMFDTSLKLPSPTLFTNCARCRSWSRQQQLVLVLLGLAAIRRRCSSLRGIRASAVLQHWSHGRFATLPALPKPPVPVPWHSHLDEFGTFLPQQQPFPAQLLLTVLYGNQSRNTHLNTSCTSNGEQSQKAKGPHKKQRRMANSDLVRPRQPDG